LKITIDNKLVYIETDDKDLIKRISLLFSYAVQGAFFSPQYRAGRWDGRIRLLNKRNLSFNIGLLFRLLKWLELEKIEYELEDTRKIDGKINTDYLMEDKILYDDIKLRKYQLDAIKSFLKYRFNLPLTRGIFNLPPRSGKTLLTGALGLVLDKYPLLFIVHKIDLAYQTKEVFEKLYNKKIGIVGDGKFIINSDVIVSTIQSIYRTVESSVFDFGKNFVGEVIEKDIDNKQKEKFKEIISRVRTVISDECHVSSSDTWQKLPKYLESIEYGIGCTGTPFREDGAELLVEQLWGNVIYDLPRDIAVKENHILPMKIYFIHLPLISVDKFDWQSQKKQGLNENQYLINAVEKIVKRSERKNMSSVIMVREKSQGNKIQKRLGCSYLHGGVDGEERMKVYNLLNKKRIKTIVSTVTDIGVNIPSLDNVIIAGLSKSKVLAFQRIRCGTPFEGKKYGNMFILCPNIDTGKEKNYLRNHWKRLMNIYKKEKTFQIKEINYKEL